MQAADEAWIPAGLIRAQITDQLAAPTRDVEGNEFGTVTRDDLADKPRSDVAYVHYESDPRIRAHPVKQPTSTASRRSRP